MRIKRWYRLRFIKNAMEEDGTIRYENHANGCRFTISRSLWFARICRVKMKTIKCYKVFGCIKRSFAATEVDERFLGYDPRQVVNKPHLLPTFRQQSLLILRVSG